ncbi:sugar-binding protein [Saccharopolyspora taberi]|uniref:sugar-binding protein n=1 Tax=Saccharopolyspora taberi TaxID=60895 RepID=UPI0031DA217A
MLFAVRFGAAAVLATALAAGALAPAQADPDPDLGVLFVGAHPDDEASLLSTFGQWREKHGVRTGVATITRGEGGGNAAGPEEGPRLGLLREGEERRAVGGLGVTDVYNLDEADLYYTVSAPLTEHAWKHDDVLDKLVRVVRETRPEVVVTMNPAPSPGNHGNHQYAARLALEAYRLAADPAAFPEQITGEGLRPWSVRRVLANSAGAEEENPGPDCERTGPAPESAGRDFSVWGGRPAPSGKTWEQEEREAEREYRSQGWEGRPDIPEAPEQIGCDKLTELANRAPHAPTASAVEAPLAGALLPGDGGFPLGTGLSAAADRSRVTGGDSFGVRVTVSAPKALAAGKVGLDLPPGWRVEGDGGFGPLAPGSSAEVRFTVTAPADQIGRVVVPVRAQSPDGTGTTELCLDVVSPVVAEQARLPAVAEFQEWVEANGIPALRDVVPPVQTVPTGGSRTVQAVVRNHGSTPKSGSVVLEPPAGFAVAQAEKPFTDVPPGGTTTVGFEVTSTDPSMPTGTQGGDHPYQLVTRTDSGEARSGAALELVPAAEIPQAQADPVVDGAAAPEEYPSPWIDISSGWEGDDCAGPQDCSARAKLAWRNEKLHAIVEVTDDARGAVLAQEDCKRHWRTDALEIAIDPKGNSENTSSTFKLAVLPVTAQGPACFARDADNKQGPGGETAPGVEVASVPRPGGYTVETSIPLENVPGSVDPGRLGLNLFVYDSDTDDQVGQTRIGWSTWEGVQGDPYRWGVARLAGKPAGQPVGPPEPALPLDALASVDSPQSIAQSVRLGTSLGGAPRASAPAQVTDASATAGEVTAKLAVRGPGTVHLFAVDPTGVVLGEQVVEVDGPGERLVPIPVRDGRPAEVLAGFRSSDAATAASQSPVR